MLLRRGLLIAVVVAAAVSPPRRPTFAHRNLLFHHVTAVPLRR